MKTAAEKEEEFERRYKNGRICGDPRKYIPAGLEEAVDDITVDSDGYWAYINPGWSDDGDRIIHAYTIKDLKEGLANIREDKK